MAEKRGTAPAILAAAESAAKAADRLGEAFARELRQVLRRTERALPDILAANRLDLLGEGDVASRALWRAASRYQIRQALRRAGFDALAEGAYGPALDPVVRKVLALRRASGFTDAQLTPNQALQLEAFGAIYRLDLLGEGDVATRALWRAAVRGVFGGSNVRVILDELAKILDRTEPQIRTLYDTSVSVLGRQVESLQASDDPTTLFAFVGPVDSVTRPWCLEHVGRVYTRAEIDALNNGQISPVFLTGGGYACRHVFIELSRASELRDLHGTDERIPEVQVELKALKGAA